MNKAEQLQRVNDKQAKLLKKLGFNWLTDGYYFLDGEDIDLDDNRNHNAYDLHYSAPTIALALEYIMEEKGIINWVQCDVFHQWTGCYFFNRAQLQTDIYKTKRDAESALLDELLTLLESIDELGW